jgi:hypothetical protein
LRDSVYSLNHVEHDKNKMSKTERRDRFFRDVDERFRNIDNEFEMLVDNHNNHDSGLKGWSNVNIEDGANKRMGQAVLVAGTVTVNNTSVTASTRIFLSRQIAGGTLGHLSVGTVTASTSFVINSSSGTDTSTINWLLIEPK